MRHMILIAGVAGMLAAGAAPFTLVKDPEREQTKLERCGPAYVAELRALTDRRIAEIRATPNMKIPAGAACYYLSSARGDDTRDGRTPATAWRTTARLDAESIAPGSFVLFERGGLYRNGFNASEGVTYTAWGEGPKPVVTTSPRDGAVPSFWQQSGVKNVWVCDIGTLDVGTMVFDGGERHAIKILPVYGKDGNCTGQYTKRPFRDHRDLDTDLHFWHDYAKTKLKGSTGSGKLYLYSERNPGERFKSIEFSIRLHGVRVGRKNNVTVDNLCVMYVGSHGVGAGTVNGLTVTNCEFGWIGGSIQAEEIFGRNWAVRYGNAVEIYGGCDGYLVDNCYAYQIYDAAFTHQYNIPESAGAKRFDEKNIRYSNNVAEKCNYSIEYFLTARKAQGNMSRMENVLFENNLMWDAGEGLCEQRPDLNEAAHIKSWNHGERNRAKNYAIRNNLMANSKKMLVQIASGLRNGDGSDSLPLMEGNVFIGAAGGQPFGGIVQDGPCRLDYSDDSQRMVNGRGRGNRCYTISDVE